jgi:hypothetical protein
MGQAVHGASCPWGELSMGGVVMGQVVMWRVVQESGNRPFRTYASVPAIPQPIFTSPAITIEIHDHATTEGWREVLEEEGGLARRIQPGQGGKRKSKCFCCFTPQVGAALLFRPGCAAP